MNKESVLAVYPHAKCVKSSDSQWIIWEDSIPSLYLSSSAVSEERAWTNAFNQISFEMVRKLEQ